MQVCTLPIRQVALDSRLWSMAITSRAFSISSASNKVAQMLHTPSTLSDDPELATGSTRSSKQESSNAWYRHKYATDPIWREKRLVRKSAWEAARRASNPEWVARNNQEDLRNYHNKYKIDPYYTIRHALRIWIYASPHIRDRLSWENHVPRSSL